MSNHGPSACLTLLAWVVHWLCLDQLCVLMYVCWIVLHCSDLPPGQKVKRQSKCCIAAEQHRLFHKLWWRNLDNYISACYRGKASFFWSCCPKYIDINSPVHEKVVPHHDSDNGWECQSQESRVCMAGWQAPHSVQGHHSQQPVYMEILPQIPTDTKHDHWQNATISFNFVLMYVNFYWGGLNTGSQNSLVIYLKWMFINVEPATLGS